VPEHTLEGYRAAIAWGAKALEVSVVRSSDGALFCLHDLTLDRTTTMAGTVAKHTRREIERARVDIPRLGPRWQGGARPKVPLLETVLDAVGNDVVLCLEAKDDKAFDSMVELVEQKGLRESVVLKLDWSSLRLGQAKEAGYPVMRYIGNVASATRENIDRVGRELDRAQDYLAIPSSEGGTLLDEVTLRAAVDTGIPVWVFAVHRRHELDTQLSRGAQGAVVSNIGYLRPGNHVISHGGWEEGALPPGLMTRRPDSNDYALGWPQPGMVSLVLQDRQAFVCLGELAPIPQALGSYQVDVQVRVDELPRTDTSNITVAFGHQDDRYYEHRQGTQDGYHALLRVDGSLELWEHRAGSVDGVQLGDPVSTPRPAVGELISLRLEITPTTLTWRRLGGQDAAVVARDSAHRGGYLHIGRSASDGRISLGRVSVT
jgi:glycerophosphoryl diester phosphodiesterase